MICKNSTTGNYCSKHYKSNESLKKESRCPYPIKIKGSENNESRICDKKTNKGHKFCSTHRNTMERRAQKNKMYKMDEEDEHSHSEEEEKPKKTKSEPKKNKSEKSKKSSVNHTSKINEVSVNRIEKKGKFYKLFCFEYDDVTYIYDRTQSLILGSTDNDMDELFDLTDEQISMFEGSKFNTQKEKSTSNKKKQKSG